MCITYFLPIVILNSIFKTLVSNPDLWKQSVHKELVHNMPFHVGIVSCDSSKVILCWDWIMYLSQKASPNVRFSENISRIGVCVYTSVLWLTDWLGLKIKLHMIMNFSFYFLFYCLVCNGVHPCCPSYGRSTQWKYFDYSLLLYFLSINQVLPHLDVSLKLINGMKFHL